MPNDVELNQKHPEQQEVLPSNADAATSPEDSTEVVARLTAEGERMTNAMLDADPPIYQQAMENNQTPGDSVLSAQIAESAANAQIIVATVAEKHQALEQRFTGQLTKIEGSENSLEKKMAEAQATREFFADGDNMTKLGEAKARSNADIPSTPIDFKSGKYAESIRANIAEAVQAKKELAAADASSEARVTAKVAREKSVARKAGIILAQAADTRAREATIKDKKFEADVKAFPAEQEKKRLEKVEALEGRVKEQYDAMVELAAAMTAYDIPELRPALKQLEQDLKGQDPADLIAKYNQGKQFEVLDNDGKPKLDEAGNTLLTIAEASVVPPGSLAKAQARLESETKGAVEKLSETISEAGQEVEKLLSYEGVRPDTVEVVGESIGKMYDLGTSPLRVLKWVAWDKSEALIVGGAAMAARAVGNLASGEMDPFLNRSIGQAKGLEKIAELQKKLSALRRDQIQAEHGNSTRKDTATDRARLARSSEPETYSSKEFVKDATTERLLSQVMDQVVRLPSDQISSEDREAIWKAIGTAQSEGNLEHIFKENSDDGSMQLELAGITLPEGLTLGKFDQATVALETKRADYMISHEKTFRRACQRLAFKMFSGDKAVQSAVLQGNFNSKIDQQGRWVISIIEGDKMTDVPIDDQVTAAVMEGIDSGKLNHNNELPPKYLEAIMTGEAYLPELDPKVSEAAVGVEQFNSQIAGFDSEWGELSKESNNTPPEQLESLCLKFSDFMSRKAKLFTDLAQNSGEPLKQKTLDYSASLTELSTLYKKEAELVKAGASDADKKPVLEQQSIELRNNTNLFGAFYHEYQATLDNAHENKLDTLVTRPENAARDTAKNKFKAGDVLQLPSDKMKLSKGGDWKITEAEKGCYTLTKVETNGAFTPALVLTEAQLDTLVTYQTNRGKPKGKPIEIKPLARRAAEVTSTPTEDEAEDDDSSDDEIAEAAKVVNLGGNEKNSTERVAEMMDIDQASQAVISDLESSYTTSGIADLRAAAVFIRDNKGRPMVARVDRDGDLLVGFRSGSDVSRSANEYVTIERSTYTSDLKRKLGKEVTNALESPVNKVAA